MRRQRAFLDVQRVEHDRRAADDRRDRYRGDVDHGDRRRRGADCYGRRRLDSHHDRGRHQAGPGARPERQLRDRLSAGETRRGFCRLCRLGIGMDHRHLRRRLLLRTHRARFRFRWCPARRVARPSGRHVQAGTGVARVRGAHRCGMGPNRRNGRRPRRVGLHAGAWTGRHGSRSRDRSLAVRP